MLYQFPFETALFTTLFDLTLIGLTYGATRIRKATYRRTFFFIIFLLFGGWSLVKLIGSSPGVAASTPNDLTFWSDSDIGTFYLARADKEGYLIYWKETIFSNEETLTIEMEGTYPDRLRILKNINGEFKELQPDLTISGNTYEPINISLADSEFGKLSNAGELALEQIWKRNLMNYASTVVSILFLTSFIWLTLKNSSNSPLASPPLNFKI